MQKNEELILEITDVTADGSGVGKYNGIVIFVPLTAVGDKVRVKILKVKKTYAYAKLEEIIIPSADRIVNNCVSFRQCGGCVFRHISYEAECRIKYNKVYETMKRIGEVSVKPMPIVASERYDRYRNKAQYPVGPDGEVGFYANHSHRIVRCEACELQPEVFDRITAVCSKWIRDNGISVYNEASHKGLLRHIYIRIAETTDEIMVTAVINGKKLPFSEEFVNALKKVCGKSLKSVHLNFNLKNTNVILGDECKVIFGEKYIIDILCGVKIRLSPMSFYQVNRDMAEKLYKKASEYVSPGGCDILDLYCGAGAIGLSMADKAKSIIGVEIVPQAVEDAKFNAKNNNITNARFICADAAEAAEKLAKENIAPEVVIVDPPRKGCTPELISVIAEKFNPERVVYVSCDPATLARDIKLFGKKGYALKEYTPIDLFPRTNHVETVALLSKLKSKQHIEVDLSIDELDLTAAESKATYEEIIAYVLKTTGLKVSHLNIAQVKRKCGIIERDNYNQPKTENSRQPKCTPEKEQAIKSALKHFNMIQEE